MATSNNHNRTRSRWGMCLNDSCEKSKNHERIEIVGRKEFVCPECGKPLKECPPPVSKPWGKYAAIAAAVLVLGGGGAYFALSSGGDKEAEKAVATTANQKKVDTPAVDSAAVEQPQQKTPATEAPTTTDNAPVAQAEPAKTAEPTSKPKVVKAPQTTAPSKEAQPVNRPYGTVRVAYGSYTGDLRNGKPHGHGTVKFTSTYTINSSIVAHAGDSYEGEFRDGRISGGPGYWSHDGDKKYVNP